MSTTSQVVFFNLALFKSFKFICPCLFTYLAAQNLISSVQTNFRILAMLYICFFITFSQQNVNRNCNPSTCVFHMCVYNILHVYHYHTLLAIDDQHSRDLFKHYPCICASHRCVYNILHPLFAIDDQHSRGLFKRNIRDFLLYNKNDNSCAFWIKVGMHMCIGDITISTCPDINVELVSGNYYYWGPTETNWDCFWFRFVHIACLVFLHDIFMCITMLFF